jgi:hypothetical protein
MPWVFTYNDWSAGTEYDFMVKAAVVSAVEVARMKPYCMYSGNTSGDMYKWFVSKGVVIIQVSHAAFPTAPGGQALLHYNLGRASSSSSLAGLLLPLHCACSMHQHGGMR